ncbi:2-succinyl-5-enolpyruvyl-6-hydroxy-3-cyclohexene-1-carboxylic-acid synthase [Jejudonia soesokkakensis]|uniref:2-succinyl-5-enolpyruvyl-6-hydroxy-3-cyclohexene-1-carboxylate synthase n=1 Tax=Jejudonia soesokkakensis TaxID=1323432 RepID=A0ABW2MRE0_9FLAO
MKFSSKVLSQTVVQLCYAKDIVHIVISPGSRNAPLTIGFNEHGKFKNFSIVDERCAAFFALGMAQQLQKPVVLVCTSGSALLNYYPAIAEAFYSDIPLVVLSADRPQNLVDIGDGQTINQENVFSNHILYNANCKEGDEHQIFNETEINVALNTAIELKGPVHINLPFSEPLYNVVDDVQVQPQHVPARSTNTASSESFVKELKPFVEKWNQSKKKMILVGVLSPESVEQQYINSLANDPSVLVLTETTSNIHHDHFISAIDQLIAPLKEADFEALQPDILLTFGGMIVSKKIKAFLRNHAPKEHWHVDEKKAYDTFFSLKKHFKVCPNQFLKSFLSEAKSTESEYHEAWKQVKDWRTQKHAQYLKQIPFCDFKVHEHIISSLSNPMDMQLSNSTAIRYSQLFTIPEKVHVYCNRGTSGIDGSTSTAIGAAYASARQTVLVTGDLGFLYDSNALWNDHIPNSFRIIVINNGGGGIFRILPKAKDAKNFEHFFETKHTLTSMHLCAMFGLEYTTAASEETLQKELKTFYNASESPKLLEVFTPSQINDQVLLEYFQFIA